MKKILICFSFLYFYNVTIMTASATELFKIMNIYPKDKNVHMILNNQEVVIPLKQKNEGIQIRVFYHLSAKGRPVIDSYIGLPLKTYKT